MIRRPQRKLYLNANAEPEFRTYQLDDEVCLQASREVSVSRATLHERVEPASRAGEIRRPASWDASTRAESERPRPAPSL